MVSGIFSIYLWTSKGCGQRQSGHAKDIFPLI
jgi:hypothetical protein